MAQTMAIGTTGSQTPEKQPSPTVIDKASAEDHHGYRPVEKGQHLVSDSDDISDDYDTHRQTRSLFTILSEWRWEFVSWVFGTLCIAAMVGILVAFRDKPLDEWYSQIRITAVISALAQAAQSGLMMEVASCVGQLKWPWLKKNRKTFDIQQFEDATRGPRGSLMLLAATITKPEGILVAIGALVTLLMLAFGTFAQQTVKIVTKDFILPSVHAELPYASGYNSSQGGFWKAGTGDSQMARDFYLKTALVSGIASSKQSLSDITGSCLATRCIWPQFDSLGVCVSVEDMSSKVVDVVDRSNSTLSNAVRFSIDGALIKPPPIEPGRTDTFWMTSTTFGSKDLPAPQQLAPSKLSGLANVYVLYMNPCTGVNQTVEVGETENYSQEIRKAQNWRAFKASFSPCVQTMVSEFNVTMNTTVLEERKDLEWQATTILQQEKIGNFTFNTWCDPRNSNICFTNSTLFHMGAQLQSPFSGIASTVPGGDNYLFGEFVEHFVADFLGTDPTKCNLTEFTTQLDFTAFTKRMKNVAIALSNAMRTRDSQSLIQGQSWQREPFIVVEFAWFAYPAALWLLATVFFFTSVLGTRRSDIPIWKSNPLVLLQIKDEQNKMQNLNSIDDEAKNTNTELRYRGGRWSLRDTPGTG